MELSPLSDRIVVRMEEPEKTTKGGIILTNVDKVRTTIGEVISVGPGLRNTEGNYIPMDVKVGDKILVGQYSGSPIKLDDVAYVVMRQVDILGILRDKPKEA